MGREGSIERTRGLYRILESPVPYAVLQRSVGVTRVYRELVTRFLDLKPGMRVLDVGAGTAMLRDALGDVSYTALEPNPRYVSQMRERFAGGSESVIQGTSAAMSELDGSYDRIIMFALLHHLDDGAAANAFQRAAELLTATVASSRWTTVSTLAKAAFPGSLQRLTVARTCGDTTDMRTLHVRPSTRSGWRSQPTCTGFRTAMSGPCAKGHGKRTRAPASWRHEVSAAASYDPSHPSRRDPGLATTDRCTMPLAGSARSTIRPDDHCGAHHRVRSRAPRPALRSSPS